MSNPISNKAKIPPEVERQKQEILSFINNNDYLQSLLYDLDLLPEQLKFPSPEWAKLVAIASHFKVAMEHPTAQLRSDLAAAQKQVEGWENDLKLAHEQGLEQGSTERQQLREALEQIAKMKLSWNGTFNCRQIAAAALASKAKGGDGK